MKTVRLYFDGETEMGCYIQGAFVEVFEEHTMLQVVRAIAKEGYVRFMIYESNMKRLARVPEFLR